MAIKEEKTTQEIKNYALKQQALQEKFAQVKQAVQLIDLTKTETRTFTVFSKDKLRQYMQNPKTNESNLRNLSRFLYRVSHNYRRLISYQAEMVDLTALNVIPQIDFTEDTHDDEKIKITYQETGKDGFQSFTVPKENQYNKLIVEYLNKFKLFQ